MRCFPLSLMMTATLISSPTWAQDESGVQFQQVEIISSGPVEGAFIPEGGANEVQIFGGDAGDNVMIMSSDVSFADVGGSFLDSPASKSSHLMDLLGNEGIRKEIELIDGQYEKMQKFQKKRSSDVQKVLKNIMKGGKLDLKNFDPTSITKTVEKHKAAAEKELEDMLLPHQIERLRQVSRQVRIQRMGTAQALASGELGDALKLTDDEKKKLRDKAKDVEARVKAEIAKIKSNARKELIDTLPPEKQEKLKELIGSDFQYERPDMKSRLRRMMGQRQRKGEVKTE